MESISRLLNLVETCDDAMKKIVKIQNDLRIQLKILDEMGQSQTPRTIRLRQLYEQIQRELTMDE